MQAARRASLRILGLAMVGCLLLPLVLLASGAVVIRGAAYRDSDDRLVRTADILHEQALKVFQSTDVLLHTITTMTAGLPDARILAEGEHWQQLLASIARGLPEVQGIWISGADGHPLATSRAGELPGIDVRQRDFFAAQNGAPHGTYIGEVRPPLFPGTEPFFTLSVRRTAADGGFGGVIAVTLLPSDFQRFYAEADPGPGRFLAMYRDDGTRLAGYPATPAGHAPAPPPLARLAAAHAPGDVFSWTGSDGQERRIAWRRVAPYPVFVLAGVPSAEVRSEWLATLASHLVFGVPVTLLLLGALWVAMIRTRAQFDEAERRAAAEEALQKSQRLEALGELTGGVAHDFNNLLMIVLGSVDRMRRRPREAADIRALDMIVTAVRRGEALTRQLLSFARRRALFPEPLDLLRALEDMRGLLAHSLRGDIELVIEPQSPPGELVVKVDPAELELAVLNIAVNARDAMPKGGRLTLRLRLVRLTGKRELDELAGDFVALSFGDTGVGIPPEVLARVFDPFFTTKDIGKGTGLGLSQVYGFARQSGGTAAIESNPGLGTTVTIYLPRSDEPVPARPPPAPQSSMPGAGLRVLLVEDNDEVAGVARMRLEMLGFDVAVADSGRAALSLLDMQTYALVVTDILMPGGMSGVDLVHELRDRGVTVPVILASGYSGAAEQARRDGFTVLQKPFDDARLREAVTAALFGASAEAPGGP